MSDARTNRRLAQPREQVLEAALAMIAEHGLSGLTMASLGARLGTSGGHLLYYFGTKDRLLLETLRWSESSYTERREELVAGAEGVEDLETGFLAYADLYLPAHASDPRWQLWLELWARAPYDRVLAEGQWELDTPWRDALTRLLDRTLAEAGRRGSEESAWVDRTLAMLDGFSIAVVTGAPVDRDEVLRLLGLHVRELRGA